MTTYPLETKPSKDVKYINGIDEIIRLNEKAIKANYGRTVPITNFIDRVCELAGKTSPEVWNYVFPIVGELTLVHNDSEIRVTFMIGSKTRSNGDKDTALAAIDMSFEDYEALPSIRHENEILTTIH